MHDERADARALAEHLGLPFHEGELGISDVVDSFPALVLSLDDPIADMANFCYQAIMQLARSHDVPVMFRGQGGDELFWAYPYLREVVEQSLERMASQSDAGICSGTTAPGQIVSYDRAGERGREVAVQGDQLRGVGDVGERMPRPSTRIRSALATSSRSCSSVDGRCSLLA
jgi:asparagine synthetase B (glutamine-hydrolysing)